ncbi:OLC1v1005555C1 [Oldenlandia corymbosa var. corymbosa]|uniref:OLC1v1005555C1 n=1 Tax=Oldenlandia corymbosa var. corymbosa TaxID=529605 RepID=A0AAV1DEW6_OLDCO|nr:OLC1v1005555C1 [Oldenlandia corymbosa var. corymbosa]
MGGLCLIKSSVGSPTTMLDDDGGEEDGDGDEFKSIRDRLNLGENPPTLNFAKGKRKIHNEDPKATNGAPLKMVKSENEVKPDKNETPTKRTVTPTHQPSTETTSHIRTFKVSNSHGTSIVVMMLPDNDAASLDPATRGTLRGRYIGPKTNITLFSWATDTAHLN